MVKLRAKDNKELETLLMTRINSIHNVSSTRTHIALSTFKESAKLSSTPFPNVFFDRNSICLTPMIPTTEFFKETAHAHVTCF